MLHTHKLVRQALRDARVRVCEFATTFCRRRTGRGGDPRRRDVQLQRALGDLLGPGALGALRTHRLVPRPLVSRLQIRNVALDDQVDDF